MNREQHVAREWHPDLIWDEAHPRMPAGTRNRLKRLNRAVAAGSEILQMLVRDRRGRADAEQRGTPHTGLEPIQLEALELAALELAHTADRLLDELREDSP